ncbi:MAG TPA: HAMP domain-containing sensor histidine kinase [Dissulfurispiraceae bacterium]|nr:HAMP domain-containing sensor histidine kinase [Dissulfurispiraceae bacterium]
MSIAERILNRVAQKKQDFIDYGFSSAENAALIAFFDLSQEFDTLEDFHALCVSIPKIFFGHDSRLFMVSEKDSRLSLVAQTTDERELQSDPLPDVCPSEDPYMTEDMRLVVSVKGRDFLMDQLPFRTHDGVIGLLELFPFIQRPPQWMFFYGKYANRIGYNLHNKFLALKNEQHLRFIRTLVADIEHNVIVPNMIFRLYLRQLKGRLQQAQAVEDELAQHASQDDNRVVNLPRLLEEIADVNRGLKAEYENIERHYNNMSLFLETLFRRSHFDQGRLILRTKLCNLKKEIVEPQLDRYREQFASRGITIDDRFSGLPDEEMISVVDVGLIAQVYANFFSNALKYTESIIVEDGGKKKYISYGREILHNFFGEGRDGIKYNIFSTGSHISADERERIFQEGGRADNATARPGSGHGLFFIRNAVEIHGGKVGYEPTEHGNNFFFILPKDPL